MGFTNIVDTSVSEFKLAYYMLFIKQKISFDAVEIKFDVGVSSGISPTATKLEIIGEWEYDTETSFVLARREGEVVPLDASNFLLSRYPLVIISLTTLMQMYI